MSCVQVAAQVLRFRMAGSFDPQGLHSLFSLCCFVTWQSLARSWSKVLHVMLVLYPSHLPLRQMT